MDMRKYSTGVIMPEDLSDGSRTEKIINISEHDKHDCHVLELESGDQLYLWKSQARILNKAWGHDSAGWIGQELDLSLGHYTDKKTDTEKETIVVRAISPRKEIAAGTNGGGTEVVASKPVSLRGEMDDEIPFMREWR
jgi:hypothetical protein